MVLHTTRRHIFILIVPFTRGRDTTAIVMEYTIGAKLLSSISSPASVAQRAERRTRDREVPDSKLACVIWFFPYAMKLNRYC